MRPPQSHKRELFIILFGETLTVATYRGHFNANYRVKWNYFNLSLYPFNSESVISYRAGLMLDIYPGEGGA